MKPGRPMWLCECRCGKSVVKSSTSLTKQNGVKSCGCLRHQKSPELIDLTDMTFGALRVLYQGVTLGGTGKDVGKRHPTLGNNVMVGSGAKVLGPFRVGNNARIAANAVVLREVPEGATVVGVPGRIVRLCGDKLDHIHTPDPVMLEIEELKRRMALLEEQINDTKKET